MLVPLNNCQDYKIICTEGNTQMREELIGIPREFPAAEGSLGQTKAPRVQDK